MGEMIDARPEVIAFAQQMELALKAHDEDRGTQGWKTASLRDLYRWSRRYHDSIGLEIKTIDSSPDVRAFIGRPDGADLAKIARKAVHLANIAMMIADVALAPTQEARP